MNASKSTVIVARQFRGSRLYLTHAKACEFAWSNERGNALPVSVAAALRIIADVEAFERGSNAFAVNARGEVIKAGASIDESEEAALDAHLSIKRGQFCQLCADHYGPTDQGNGVCDEGKPVASPHRVQS